MLDVQLGGDRTGMKCAQEKSRFFWAAPSRGSVPWHSCVMHLYITHWSQTCQRLPSSRQPQWLNVLMFGSLIFWAASVARPLCFLSAQNQNQNLMWSEAHSITRCGRSGCQRLTFLPPWASTDIVLMFPAVLLENYKMSQSDVPKETRVSSRWAGRIVSAAAVRRNQHSRFKLLKVVLELLF